MNKKTYQCEYCNKKYRWLDDKMEYCRDCGCGNLKIVSGIPTKCNKWEPFLAKAKLYQAAPELLEALKDLVVIFDKGQCPVCDEQISLNDCEKINSHLPKCKVSAALKAIAKATGE